ncbi:Vacuolar protein sorting-associated protein 3 [Escovopsis weberi]|uniref:Vacuolar protein sorting-associated protein 3 n=1 Tax=Escovopsis weberi TaxID=150374 RepID=A0A0N0RSX1_ESCWE|nr:Vacuolar protein sorting-associated protein 3 [Escovopsis weberi]
MTSPSPSPAPSTTNTAAAAAAAVRSLARDDGPYVLRPWVDPVPLSVDGTQDGIRINCVEYYDGNLYVGTSASELLHFVRLPPDPADKFGRPVFIPASRLTPVFNENATSRPGVQQILLLPRVGKACILCNRTVTFYSLPELTPSGTREVNNCNWIGGVDLNEQDSDEEVSGLGGSVIILLSTNKRIQVVKIEDGNIDFAGSTLSVRRDSIACVADSKTYALIDVDHQLKIPLMSISSLEDGPSPESTVDAAASR